MVRSILRIAAVLGILLSTTQHALAQQPPDCASCVCAFANGINTAQSLAGAATITQHNTNFANVGDALTWNTAFNNRWQRVYLVAGNRYSLSLCGNTQNTYMYLTNGTGTVILGCDDNSCGGTQSIINWTAQITGLHRLYVYNASCGNYFAQDLTFTMTRIAPQPAPPNDAPCGAVALPLNSTCVDVNTSSVGASLSGAASPSGCTDAVGGFAASLIQNDVWFTTTVPASGLLGIETTEAGLCAGAFALYTAPACGGTMTQIAGSCSLLGTTGATSEPAGVFDVSSLPVGSTIYIQFWERNGDENGTFQICAYEAEPPVNDEPCGAVNIPITANCTPATFSNAVATDLSTVTTAPAAVSCGAPASGDIWFSVVVPATGSMTVTSQAGTLGDMAMAWYRLSAGALCGPGTMTEIACSTTGLGASTMPRINSSQVVPNPLLVAGETIYVRMWSQTPWTGTFTMCAIENTPPVNDNPCGALPLLTNYGCLLTGFSNENGSMTPTGLYGAGSIPNPSCGGLPNSDVWFTVQVPPNGVLQLDTDDGLVVNGGMALYRPIGGTCGGNNLQLQQVACSNTGSQQGNNSMPYINATGLIAGETLYVRFWRQGATGVDGSFSLCARRTDPPPQTCFYTLTMNDTGGDGWNGSTVEVCVGGVCNTYTVNGSTASINIGTNIGQVISVEYTAAGGFQNQNSYQLTQFGGPVFLSGSPPTQGLAFVETVDCEPPPAPPSDCIGAFTLCDQTLIVNQNPTNTGGIADLNVSNRGCLSGNERQGLWYTFSTMCSGNVAFTITPSSGADYDFGVWGPMAQLTCPPVGPPVRCSWAAGSGATGLSINPALPTSEGAGGTSFVRHLTVNAGDLYILYIDNWSMNGVQFTLTWNAGNSTCPPNPQTNPSGSIVGCTILPVELLDFTASPDLRSVDIAWSTASEHESDHFNVLRSADGQDFASIGRVDAAGHSINLTNYAMVDDAPLPGLSYYRLLQVDKDGQQAYSHIVPVYFGERHGSLMLMPNPTEGSVEVRFDINDDGPVRWRVMDGSGRLVRDGSIAAHAGTNRSTLDLAVLESGSYLFELLDDRGGTVGITRFVKL